MGQFLSLAGNKSKTSECSDILQAETCKRQRMSLGFNESSILIPSLPNEISLQILARLPRICYLNMKLVSRSWKSSITSPELYQFRKELGTTEEWLYILTKIEEDKHIWYALDPLSKEWQRLPPMPNVVNEEEPRRGFSGHWMSNLVGSSIKTADVIRGLLGRKDAWDRMPFCGCATGAVDGCLYVVGGFVRASAVRCVWQYDPCENAWSEVTSMSFGRAYCKTGVLNNRLYVVGGVSRGKGKGGLTPLQSAEMFDPRMGTWTTLPSMPFSRARVLPTSVLADALKPIATGMASYRGRLCVPQSLYSWPFFVDVGGEIFDPETNVWVQMPTGMGKRWPGRQAGTKWSVVVDGELHALDPSSSLDNGKIKIYDSKEDVWKLIKGKVPIRDFTRTEFPYLLSGFLGKLHVIANDVNNELSVLQADLRNDVASLPSTSSSSPTASTLCENSDPLGEEAAYIWKIIATKNFGSAELVSCQVLDI